MSRSSNGMGEISSSSFWSLARYELDVTIQDWPRNVLRIIRCSLSVDGVRPSFRFPTSHRLPGLSPTDICHSTGSIVSVSCLMECRDSVGVYVDSELSRGSTASSRTFGNEPLASEAKFEVLGLEVWGIGSS